MAKKQNPFSRQVKAISSWELVPLSLRLAIKNYEQIAFLFFLPSLIMILGLFYLGNFTLNIHNVLDPVLSSSQAIGIVLMLLWVIVSIINFPPSIYFRLHASVDNKSPSIATCYREGFNNFFKVWLCELISILLIIIGFFAFLLPGVLIFPRLILAPYYAMDKPKLSIKQILSITSKQASRFTYPIYGTYGIIILLGFVSEIILGTYLISAVLIVIISYIVLFMPALRYLEITKFYNKKAKVQNL